MSSVTMNPKAVQFLVPNGRRVIVLEDEGPKKIGRLYVPETAQKRSTTGTVIAAPPTNDDGTRPWLDSPEYDEIRWWLGKRVVYAQFSGTLLAFKNQPAYRVLGLEEIQAEVTKDDVELEETTS